MTGRLRRRIASRACAATAAVVVLTTAVAGAATLGPSGGSLGAGRASTLVCTSAGVTLTQTVLFGRIVAVTVSAIPSACGGGSVYATVYDGTTTGATGAVAIPAGGGSVTTFLSAQPNASASNQSTIVLQGP